ncbi:MAG: hypothetical protein AAGE85_08060 [Pseudomonadota bacterium]
MRWTTLTNKKLCAVALVFMLAGLSACSGQAVRDGAPSCGKAQAICGHWVMHDFEDGSNHHKEGHHEHLYPEPDAEGPSASPHSEFTIYRSIFGNTKTKRRAAMRDGLRWWSVRFRPPTESQLKYLSRIVRAVPAAHRDMTVPDKTCIAMRTCFIGTLKVAHHGPDAGRYAQYHMIFLRRVGGEEKSSTSCKDEPDKECLSVRVFCYQTKADGGKSCSRKLPAAVPEDQDVLGSRHLGSGHAHNGGDRRSQVVRRE